MSSKPYLSAPKQAERFADGWMIFTTDTNVPFVATLAD
jgi:hypothetical protein